VTRIEDLRLRRNNTIRFAVAVLLNWILAVFVVVNTWIDLDAATALHVSAYFVPIAIISSFGLLLTRIRPYQSKALGGLSWLCVCAPLFWVVLIIAVM
jgi:hypothetical protein